MNDFAVARMERSAAVQPVTPAMALRFGKLLGNGPDLWIDLQRAYDLHVAEKQLGKALAKIPTITAA
jgi:plasmid maintenance system antidote protein VapI